MTQQIEELRIKALALSKVLGEVMVLIAEIRTEKVNNRHDDSKFIELYTYSIKAEALRQGLVADMKELAREEALLISEAEYQDERINFFNIGAL